MAILAVVKSGGKQYLLKQDDIVTVDKVAREDGKKDVELETLAVINTEKNTIDLGNPYLKSRTKAEIVEDIKGDKIRVAKFKAKVRYRKVQGFRPQLSKLKILKI